MGGEFEIYKGELSVIVYNMVDDMFVAIEELGRLIAGFYLMFQMF